jgi:predicted dehydrogenase/threonine dehydrogenase-like Zn-dependent dehydrogenase
MKQVFLVGSGQVEVVEAPVPARLLDSVLVRNECSLISAGTEAAAVTKRSGLLGLCEKAVSSRERVGEVWALARSKGILRAWDTIRQKLEEYSPIGYSCAGTVVEVDHPGMPFAPGHRVACMGAGFAAHAELVVVPKNLVIRIPDNVSFEEGAFGAIGCIALQGIRRLDLTPGERVGVIGLGLVGQVCGRLLSAMGYEVFGMDLLTERAQKLGEVEGAHAWVLGGPDSVRRVEELTEGKGLDGVVVCAASPSDEPVNLAFDLCRAQGRVSVVGDVGLHLAREKMFAKELDLRMSRSYGPGRYDAQYELAGHDYPPGYVRWTEGRNLEYFLHLLSTHRIDLGPLVSARFPVDEAPTAYSRLKQADPDTYGLVFRYRTPDDIPSRATWATADAPVGPARRVTPGRPVRLGLIGIGGFAKGVHIPNLKTLRSAFEVKGVASRSTASAALGGKLTSASIVATDYRALLSSPEIDAVLIATRHASHARIACDALRAGKHVFVEKPLSTTVEDGLAVEKLARDTGLVVRVGFNRRFAPHLGALRSAIGPNGVRMLSCRVNLGSVPDDWSNTPEEGGRLIGEGVHFFDFFNWFMCASPVSVSATFAGSPKVDNPNVVVSMQYRDGSVAQLVYTSLGDASMGKEHYEAFGNGRSARLDDFNELTVFGASSRVPRHARGDKGQLAELKEFSAAIRGEHYAIAGADAQAGRVATAIALAAYESAVRRRTVELDG